MTRLSSCLSVLFDATDVAFHVLANVALKQPIRSAEAAIYGAIYAVSSAVLQRKVVARYWPRDFDQSARVSELFRKIVVQPCRKLNWGVIACVPATGISWGLTKPIMESVFSFDDAVGLSVAAFGLKWGIAALALVGAAIYTRPCRYEEDSAPLREEPLPELEEREPLPQHCAIDLSQEEASV